MHNYHLDEYIISLINNTITLCGRVLILLLLQS